MFPKGAVTATAPLSWRLAHPKHHGHGGRLLDLPPVAGMGHFPLLLRWETQALGALLSAGTPWSCGPKLRPHGEERSASACPSIPKLFSHPGAPRLHPTHSTLVPSPAPCCPHGPQHLQSQALGKEPSDLQHSSLQINNPRPAVGAVGCSMGHPHEPHTTETHSSFSSQL